MSRRPRYDDLQATAAALARARETGADPWRVTELQLRHDRLLESALATEETLDDDGPPRPRRGWGGL